MKTRLLHFLIAALGVVTLLLTFAQKIPKYAAIAGSALLLVSNFEKMFPALADAVKKMFPAAVVAILFLIAALPACSFLTGVKNSCEPTKSDATTIVADLTPSDYQSLLEAEAIKVGVCVVDKVVGDFVAQHSPDAGTTAKAEEPIELQHARVWLARPAKS